jgi:hypothetical protein
MPETFIAIGTFFLFFETKQTEVPCSPQRREINIAIGTYGAHCMYHKVSPDGCMLIIEPELFLEK